MRIPPRVALILLDLRPRPSLFQLHVTAHSHNNKEVGSVVSGEQQPKDKIGLLFFGCW